MITIFILLVAIAVGFEDGAASGLFALFALGLLDSVLDGLKTVNNNLVNAFGHFKPEQK